MAKRRRWGGGSVYQEPNGNWAIKWRNADGDRPYKGGFRSRLEADRVLASILGAKADGRAGIAPDPSAFPTLQEQFDIWIERRKKTHAAWNDDRSRWNCHLKKHVAHLRPAQVTPAVIRQVVEDRRSAGLSKQTCQHVVRLLSTFYTDLCERPKETGVSSNPVKALPKSTRKLVKPDHNPATTPYLKSDAVIAEVYAALEDPVRTAFAIGVLSGLRPGEIRGLEWKHIDFDRKMILVRQQVVDSKLCPPKDGDPRDVPIFDDLMPELLRFRHQTGGEGFLFAPKQPGRKAGKNGTRSRFMRPNTLNDALDLVLGKTKLEMTWYEATKHTFASHFLINGGSIERLAVILGHSTSEVTKVYGHLTTEHITDQDRKRFSPLSVRIWSDRAISKSETSLNSSML